MKSELDIYVFTADRDFGDIESYPGVETDRWLTLDGYHIYYASPRNLSWKSMVSLINDTAPDYLYLNGMFSRYFSIYPLLMKRFGTIVPKVVIAPRGMLKKSALSHKPFKKQVFLKLIGISGMMTSLTFQATDAQEVSDIRLHFGSLPCIIEVENLPARQSNFISPSLKVKGSLKVVFVGRIHPIKNLDYLLSLLQLSNRKIHLTIVAPIEDEGYWKKCQEIILKLTTNIEITHYENVPHGQIASIILANHIFALPTAGENFGHAIFEALSAGRPVLISDQTPWKNLENENAGWDVSLNDKTRFLEVLDYVAGMSYGELDQWCRGAWVYCQKYLEKLDSKKNYLKIFS